MLAEELPEIILEALFFYAVIAKHLNEGNSMNISIVSKGVTASVNLSCLHAGNYGPFDYISVTPPYTQVDYGVLMRQISESSLVGEDAFIVCSSFFLILGLNGLLLTKFILNYLVLI